MSQVAIIIPTLNEEAHIAKCLDSVLAQTYPFADTDLMVIDGGSVDGTKLIVEGYISKYPNIRFLHNPGKIQSVAFNIGVRESTALYVIRLDAHATYCPRYIELCVKHLAANADYGNVGGFLGGKPHNNSLQAEANAILNKVKFGIGGSTFRVGAKAGFVDTVPFGAFSRKTIEAVGGMREDLARGEDNEYNSRIRKAGYKIYIDPEIVSYYVARPTIWSSMRQMYANGVSIGKLLYIDRASVGLRHLVPLAFVLSILASLFATFVFAPARDLLVAILCSYAFAATIATLSACLKYGFRTVFVLPLLFFLVHCSYGWGTIVGIIRK